MRPFAFEITPADFALAARHRFIAARSERDSRPVILPSALDGRPFLVLVALDGSAQGANSTDLELN
jgi:hypothetical protein